MNFVGYLQQCLLFFSQFYFYSIFRANQHILERKSMVQAASILLQKKYIRFDYKILLHDIQVDRNCFTQFFDEKSFSDKIFLIQLILLDPQTLCYLIQQAQKAYPQYESHWLTLQTELRSDCRMNCLFLCCFCDGGGASSSRHHRIDCLCCCCQRCSRTAGLERSSGCSGSDWGLGQSYLDSHRSYLGSLRSCLGSHRSCLVVRLLRVCWSSRGWRHLGALENQLYLETMDQYPHVRGCRLLSQRRQARARLTRRTSLKYIR